LCYWHNPSGRTVVGSTSNRNACQEYFLRGKGGGLTTLMCLLSLNLGASITWKPQCLSRPVMGLLYLTDNVSWVLEDFFSNLSRGMSAYIIH